MQYEDRRMEIRAEGTLGIPLQKVSKKGVSDKAIGFYPSSEKVVSSSNEPSNVDIENYVSSIVGIHTLPHNTGMELGTNYMVANPTRPALF